MELSICSIAPLFIMLVKRIQPKQSKDDQCDFYPRQHALYTGNKQHNDGGSRLLMILSLMVGLQMDFVKSRSTDIAKPNRKKTAPSLELTETPQPSTLITSVCSRRNNDGQENIGDKRLNYPIPPINIIHRNIKEQFNPTVRPGIFLKVAYP